MDEKVLKSGIMVALFNDTLNNQGTRMTAKILDGKAIAAELRDSIKQEVDLQVAAGKPRPGLAVIMVGEDPASQVYVRNKKIACEKAGFNDVSVVLPAETTQEEVLALIDKLNADDAVHGIIVQLPVPKHIAQSRLLSVSALARTWMVSILTMSVAWPRVIYSWHLVLRMVL